MIQLLLELFRSLKLGSASRAQISDAQCVACDSKDLTPLGPGAYRCNACGYEGGSGLAAMQEQARLQSFDRMSPEERRQSALRDLLEARRILFSGIGTLESAQFMSALDMVGIGGSGYAGIAGEGGEKQSQFVSALRFVMEAQNLLKDAWYKLQGHPGGALVFDVPIDYTTWSLDLHLDSIFADIAMHSQISQAKMQAQRMLAAVEHTIRTSYGLSPPPV